MVLFSTCQCLIWYVPIVLHFIKVFAVGIFFLPVCFKTDFNLNFSFEKIFSDSLWLKSRYAESFITVKTRIEEKGFSEPEKRKKRIQLILCDRHFQLGASRRFSASPYRSRLLCIPRTYFYFFFSFEGESETRLTLRDLNSFVKRRDCRGDAFLI